MESSAKMQMGGGGGGGGGGGMGPMSPSDQPAGGSMPPMYSMDMMHASFFWGTRVQILFSRWPGDHGVGMYVVALLLVFAASAFGEVLSSVLHRLSQRLIRPHRVPFALLLTSLHAVRMGLAYLVMLAVMSFNVGVLVAAIAGHAVGFLISGSGLLRRSGPSIARPNTNGLITK